MFAIFKERLQQKYRTLEYPHVLPQLSDRFLGLPAIQPGACPEDCHACLDVCPTAALRLRPQGPELDMGRCLFCGACRDACPQQKIVFTREHRLARSRREALYIRANMPEMTAPQRDLRMFSHALKLRQVSAGGCGACEADCNVLMTPVYDLGRFGIDFAASPRHCDGILVTGPVSENMRAALLDTWNAMPDPRIVIVAGSCAISGGLFRDSAECHNGAADLLPVDMYIPGCPPNPWTILDGLLRCIGRV